MMKQEMLGRGRFSHPQQRREQRARGFATASRFPTENGRSTESIAGAVVGSLLSSGSPEVPAAFKALPLLLPLAILIYLQPFIIHRIILLFRIHDKIWTGDAAYCLASCVADDPLQLERSKKSCFQSAFELDSADACSEEGYDDLVHHREKKRRLTLEQVRGLEKNFEMENKLEPERKMQIACELGLQPRQVAVWFQNRRARWKTKKLEMDFDALKIDYLSLKGKYDQLLKENERIQSEMIGLKATFQLLNNHRSEETEVMEPLQLNGLSTLDAQMLYDNKAQGKLQLGASMEDGLPRAMYEEGSSVSNAEASEVSNTSSPKRLEESKVCKANHGVATAAAAATCFLISNLNSNTQPKSFPPLLSESFLQKVQAATVKFEPGNLCEKDCCNSVVEANEEGDAPWWESWDLDYSNFCT